MRIGGSAGLRMITALLLCAPPTPFSAVAVVSVNSSMLARVPGPADFDEIDDTISAEDTNADWLTAATIGTVAWPPQVTMLRFGASMWSSRLTTGTQNGPIAAGLRSSTRTPLWRSTSQCLACAPADVASNTSRMSSKSGMASNPSMPCEEVGTPSRLARARPSDSGSMPIIAAIVNGPAVRRILIIRSVPMLPEPMIATGNRSVFMKLLLYSYSKLTVNEPSPLMTADAWSPATTNDAVVYEPDITNWPGSMAVP